MISHHHKTLFVHIPKCGGQSVEFAFLKDLALDWKNRAPLLLRPRVKDEKAPPRLAHLTLMEYLNNKYISQELFDSYYKFSVVRCPYRRVISFYNYFKYYKCMSVNEFVSDTLHLFLDPSHDKYWFFQPQLNYLTDFQGSVGVDDIYFLESLELSWSDICRFSGINDCKLPHMNKSSMAGVNGKALSSNSVDIIHKLYFVDFNFFTHYDVDFSRFI